MKQISYEVKKVAYTFKTSLCYSQENNLFTLHTNKNRHSTDSTTAQRQWVRRKLGNEDIEAENHQISLKAPSVWKYTSTFYFDSFRGCYPWVTVANMCIQSTFIYLTYLYRERIDKDIDIMYIVYLSHLFYASGD